MTDRTFGRALNVRDDFMPAPTEQPVRMTTFEEPFIDPATSTEEIFRATYLVLRDHGYAGVSIQRIADRTSLSKSTIYYHFDDKYDLLMQFSEELLTWYIDQLVVDHEGDARASLDRLLDLLLLGETADGVCFESVFAPGYVATIMEMRAQAVRNPEMREYVSRTDAMIRNHFEALLEAGMDDGSIREIDSETVASMLFLLFEGALLLRSCEDDVEWLTAVRKPVDSYLDR
ncbi:TetR/AcrR family transcriptional regulator [Salinadaptatus halalkaliphilus]|uniref:TetR/AcrR family transcriptional regulator n=1 Tax=Salinadaptatus halalkaliphilus TaxID=2419781 RepID=A0A4V3VL44_9EURY|nr:TetR/AcrR family transcriptional regulator [Salinadaptatus halalkaliphilus]THE64217.1 TetR/AcrR family transcriptional regulator [Salinadaptatus halalkaliphilus]